jgi:membrane protein DedA with SNARE-associated domain
VETVLEILGQNPALATFTLLVFCGLGLPPWSEEVVILASGYFVAEGIFEFHHAILWCWAGIIAGDSIIYGLGAWVGEGVYRWPILRSHMKPKQRNKFNRLFFKHGTTAVFLARFIPGYRMMAYFVAGNLGMRYWKFLVLDSIGAALTVPISVYAGWMLAENLDKAMALFHNYEVPVALIAIVIILIVFRRRGLKRRQRFDEIRQERADRDS